MFRMWLPKVCAYSALIAIGSIGPAAFAQDKCSSSLDMMAATSEYTEQHALEVDDLPGHKVRIYQIHRTYPDAETGCFGMKPKESWTQGISDYVGVTGSTWGYTTTLMENGDKVFSRWSGTTHTVGEGDSRKTTFTGVVTYTGGTGKYEGLRGLGRTQVKADIEAGVNEGRTDAEYWFVK